MYQPDVTLTDYVLALECAGFAIALCRGIFRGRLLAKWFAFFFASLSLASLTGGTAHGFFSDLNQPPASYLWRITLVSIGLATFAAWGSGAVIRCSKNIATRIIQAAAVQFLIYFVIILLFPQFWIAIVNYLPASLFLLYVLFSVYRKKREKKIALGLAGMVLIFAGSFLQQAKISLHPVYFTHNALYHVIQALALFLIFLSTRWFVENSSS